jgi:hypothetical protein
VKLFSVLAVVFAAAAMALVAASTASGRPSGASTPPRTWARQVCTSVSVWQKKLNGRAAVLSKVTSTDLRRLRRALTVFLSGVVTDTNSLIADIDRAGTPSLPHGAAIRKGFRVGLVQTRDYFAADARKAKKLPVSDPKRFATGAAALGKAIQRQGGAITKTFSALEGKFGSSELNKAMKPIAACSALS